MERGLLGEGDNEEDDSPGPDKVEVNEAEFRSLKHDIERVSRRVDVLTQSKASDDEDGEAVRERMEELEERFNSLRAMTAGDGGGVDAESVAEAPAVRRLDERLTTLEDDFFDHEEFVFEWMGAVETYMKAFRRVVEEKLGVSMDSYIDAVEAEEDEEDEEESVDEGETAAIGD
ncbi:hypothetical protein ACKVMT_05330 [Halobacteriales archaeon Cl-PHB]